MKILFRIFSKLWIVIQLFFKIKRLRKSVLSVAEVKEVHAMADIMIYTFDLGPFDHDVKAREVEVVVGSNVDNLIIDPKENKIIVKGAQDSLATITVVDVDDSGNRSVPVVHQYVLVDVVAPGSNSTLNVVSVQEIAGTAPAAPVEPEVPAEEPEVPAEEPEAPEEPEEQV